MAYESALKISEVVEDIHKKRYLLPAIQREFVWNTYQIEQLFDSLMRDYPISSFLFWKVTKEKVKSYEFYEFLREYHEKDNKHNPKANTSGEEEITAVLDGQQRLTSIYLALKGSIAYKIPYYRYNNPKAYPNRYLYLNLLKPSEETELFYDFNFLTKEEAEERNEDYHWFPVGKMLNYKEPHEVNEYLIENGIFTDYGKEKAAFANKVLAKLHSIIHIQPTISYYLEKSQDLDKVLNIFIRINSGGTKLSYSDLLLSIATAQWEKRDAREEIIQFVDEINAIGDGFNFNKDFVLKASLVLSDIQDIAFKVDNFDKANMLKIEDSWDSITHVIRLAVKLVSSFGFNRETLTSNNSIIPIAYYLKAIGAEENYVYTLKNLEDKSAIRKWLNIALIKRFFGGQADSVLKPLRKIMQEIKESRFPLSEILNHFKGTNKSLHFSEEDIENLLRYRYGQSYTFSVLALLYPSFDFRNHFHMDHIFPQSQFNTRNLKKRGIPDEKIGQYTDFVDYLGNLQLLEAIPNIEKQDTDFDKWLIASYPGEQDQADYLKKHHIPVMDLSFENCLGVFSEREKIIKEQFKAILQTDNIIGQASS
jgi:uncharacterized protein with ParB-like and HNH nuclease domain